MAKKKKSVKTKKVEVKLKAVKTAKKNRRRKVALILTIIAVVLLLINAITLLITKDKLIEKAQQSEQFKSLEETLTEQELNEVLTALPAIFFILAIIWIILAVASILTIYFLERKKRVWGVLLAIGIVTIFSGRFLAGVLNIISSVLYKR